MPFNKRDHRRVLLPLAAFGVSVPVRGLLDHQSALLVRETLQDVFSEAPREYLERSLLFDRPIRAQALVTNLRHGSLELDLLYRVIADLPWPEISGGAQHIIDRGYYCLKEIGSVAGGLYALKGLTGWIKSRVSRDKPELLSEDSEVEIQHISTLETQIESEMTLEQSGRIRRRLLEEKRPVSLGTVVTNPKIPHGILRPSQSGENEKNLGGATLLRDLNLFYNGIVSTEEIREGGLFFYNNFAALGLNKPKHTDSLYDAVASEDSTLSIRSVLLSTYEAPEERDTLRGKSIDADILEDA